MRTIELPQVFRTTRLADASGTAAPTFSLLEYRVSLGTPPDAYAEVGGRAAQWVEIAGRVEGWASCFAVDAAAVGVATPAAEELTADLVLYPSLQRAQRRKKGGTSCVFLSVDDQHRGETVRGVYCLCADYARVSLVSFALGKCQDTYLLCTDYLGSQPAPPERCAVPLWFVTRWNEALITVGQLALEHARHDCRDELVTWRARYAPEEARARC